MKSSFFACFLFSLLLFSCIRKKETGVITYNLSKSDYVERISVPGTIQAVVNFPVMPPRSMYGMLTVLRLSEDGAFVKKGDTICVLTVRELESLYNDMKTTTETLEAELKKTEADNKLKNTLLEAQLATSEAQLKISSLDSLKMNYASEVQQRLLTLEMKRALIEKQKIEKKLAAGKIIGETGIRQIKSRIIQQKAKSQQFEEQINAMTIIAQRDGIVMRTEAPRMMIMSTEGSGTFGGPVREGTVLPPFGSSPVLQFPDLSKMQVSAEVAEADFRKIEKGQKVSITVDAADKLLTTGIVNRKSLMGKTAQRWSNSKVKFYEVIIDIDSCHLKMKPGLSADCVITLKEARDTVYVPTLAIFERDSTRVVYVKNKNSFIPVRVEAGSSGSSHTIITSGLKGDEIIALSEPPGSLIRKDLTNSEIPDTAKAHIKP
jgi:multidrug efflux pump subunit AcrA (membrane-fusion protein)